MALLTEQLLQASFKNIDFLIRKESIDQLGQKRITHDYPNSGTRYVEAQGTVPGEFSLDVFFHGIDWKEKFQTFRKAIEDPSPGRLVMPVFGIYNSVVAFPASAEASQTEVGIITMPVKFSVTIERPSPTETTSTQEDVSEQAEKIRQSMTAEFENSYSEPTSLNNIGVAKDDLLKISDILLISAISSSIFRSSIDLALRSPTLLSELLFSTTVPYGIFYETALFNSGGTAENRYNNYKIQATYGNGLSNSMNDIRAGV